MADVALKDGLKSKKVEAFKPQPNLKMEKTQEIKIETGNIEIIKIKMLEETNIKLEKIFIQLKEMNYYLSQIHEQKVK
jgi:hypothetical protein